MTAIKAMSASNAWMVILVGVLLMDFMVLSPAKSFARRFFLSRATGKGLLIGNNGFDDFLFVCANPAANIWLSFGNGQMSFIEPHLFVLISTRPKAHAPVTGRSSAEFSHKTPTDFSSTTIKAHFLTRNRKDFFTFFLLNCFSPRGSATRVCFFPA